MKNAQRPARPAVQRKERWPVGNRLTSSLHLYIAVLLTLSCCMAPYSPAPYSPYSPAISTVAGNEPPVVMAGNLTIVEPGEEVFFHAHDSHDPDGEIVLYEWDFEGDGEYDWQSGENGTTTHAYREERAYNATLRVTDNENSSSTDIYFVIVQGDDDDDGGDVKTLVYIVGVAEIIFGVSFVVMVWWWRRNLYSG